MSKQGNLTSIEGKKKNSDFEQALFELKREMDNHLEYYRIKAELSKNYYDHLIKQGFKEEQALEIVKSDGL